MVTVEWLAARWNRWCDARTVAGSFEPRKIDLVGERPSRRYCAKVIKAFGRERADNPSFDDWSAALDALGALPEYAGQRLWGWSDDKVNRPGLAELFAAPSSDTAATKQARLWHIADGRWATWTGPSGPSGPPRQVATMPPKPAMLHPDPDSDHEAPSTTLLDPDDWSHIIDRETA